MPDEIKAIYKQVFQSPYALQFESPWQISVHLEPLDVTCSIQFEQVEYGGKVKIGPGNMDAKVRFEMQIAKMVEVDGLRSDGPGKEGAKKRYTFDNEFEVYKRLLDEMAPIADLVSALVVGRIGHLFLQKYPHIAVEFVYDSTRWGYFSVKHGELSASIGGDLLTYPIESDLVHLRESLKCLPTTGGVMNARFFLGSLLNKRPVEKFILAFAGLESIIHSTSLDMGSILSDNYEKLIAIVESIDDSKVRERMITYLREKKFVLVNHSLRDKFAALSLSIYGKPDEEDIDDFREMNQIRNDLLHGRATAIPNVPLFSSKGFSGDDPISTVQRLYLKYLYALIYTSGQK